MGDIFGQDILLDGDFKAVCDASGGLVLSDSLATGVQDIKLRLLTPLGSLFYDQNYGSLIHNFVKEENTLVNRLAFLSEVESVVEQDGRCMPGSVQCRILSFDENGIKASVSWRFISVDHEFNLVIELSEDMKGVVKDVQTAV